MLSFKRMAVIIYFLEIIVMISNNINYFSTYILENASPADKGSQSMHGPGPLFQDKRPIYTWKEMVFLERQLWL